MSNMEKNQKLTGEIFSKHIEEFGLQSHNIISPRPPLDIHWVEEMSKRKKDSTKLTTRTTFSKAVLLSKKNLETIRGLKAWVHIIKNNETGTFSMIIEIPGFITQRAPEWLHEEMEELKPEEITEE